MTHPPKEEEQPEIVNGINRTALIQLKKKMLADEAMGKDVQVCARAVWEKGIARSLDGKLVSHPPEEVALGNPQYPNMNDYCPLVSTGCFSLIYMMEAAERNVQFDYFETHMRADADFSCLYQEKEAMTHPWRNGVTLDVRIMGPSSRDEIEMLGALAEKNCPSVEIMEREFPVTTIVTGKQVEVKNKREYYDMDKYRALANSKDPVIVKQNANGIWYCHNQSKSFPGALMKFEFGFGRLKTAERHIALSYNAPIASGRYATPVQICFFGGLSTHMHTIALLLYAKGYKVERMTGIAKALMNKRAVMGIERDYYIFSSGVTLEVEVETDAPPEVVEDVQYEADRRSPGMMNWTNRVPLETRIVKEKDHANHSDDDLVSLTSENGSKPRWEGFGKMFKYLRPHAPRLSSSNARSARTSWTK